MMSNLDVERLQTRGKLRAYPDSNEPLDVEQRSGKETHPFVKHVRARGSRVQADIRPKRSSFCFVVLFRATALLFGCVIAPTAGAVDAAHGGSAGQAIKSEGSSSLAQAEEEVLVFIPDNALRWNVTGACRCGRDSPITSGDMETLERLHLGPGIVDLSGLEFASNLTSLTIVAPKVSDLEPLRGMQNLERLILGDTAVSDFSPLSGLTALRFLDWLDRDVSDLGPLANLRNLVYIALLNPKVSDLEPLRNLTRLKALHLTGSPVANLGPLSGLTQLIRLNLNDTPVSDLEPLRNLTRLLSLSLTGSQVVDLEPLSELTELNGLTLDDTPVSNLGPLARLVNLKGLSVDNAQVSSLAPLADADLPNLERLSLKNASNAHPPWDRGVECEQRPSRPTSARFSNAVSDVGPLAGLTRLEWLDLSNNRVSTLTPLAGLKSLRWLRLPGNEIRSLAGLESLSRLGVLDLTDNAVSSLEPLSSVLSLYRLYLNGNTISDLAPLSGLTRLQDLYLNDNKISGLGPLAQLRLSELDLGNNNVSDLAELGRLPRYDLYLEDNNITDVSPLLPALSALPEWNRPRIDLRRNPLDQRSAEIASQYSSIFADDDHGESPQDATVLSVGTTLEGRIDPEHDVDYFRVHIREATSVEIHTAWKHLLLHDGSGNPHAAGPWISDSLAPGTYYVSVASACIWNGFDGFYSDEVRSLSDYLLRVTTPSNIDVPDSNLRATLRDAIASRVEQEVDPITAGAMLTLRSIVAAHADIADLTGLEYARNAKGLDLSENAIFDLQPLIGMTRLVGLRASGNLISDISPLAGLKSLNNLYLSRNAVSDLFPLADLKRLQILDLSGNAVSDLSPLAGLTRLRVVDLSSNAVSDLSPLVGSTHLVRLDLRGNEISDIEPLLEIAWHPDAWIDLHDNPLSPSAVSLHIPMLEGMGVKVETQKDDHGSGWDEATWLQLGVPVFGTDDRGRFVDDLDYFHFEVTEPSFIHLSVTPEKYRGSYWELLDSGGTTLFRSLSGRLYRANVRRKLKAGVYRILVDPYRSSYTVQVNVVSAPTNLQVERDGSRATVSWESTYPGSAEIGSHAYIVVAVPVDGGAERSCWVPTNVRGCVVSGLSEYDDYEFTVREVDPRGADASRGSVPVSTLIPRSFWRGWRQFLLEQSRDEGASQ